MHHPLHTPVMLSWCDIRARLQTFLSTLFSGWLQTKFVEDVFQDARRRESHDVENKQLKISTYYAQVAEMGSLGSITDNKSNQRTMSRRHAVRPNMCFTLRGTIHHLSVLATSQDIATGTLSRPSRVKPFMQTCSLLAACT